MFFAGREFSSRRRLWPAARRELEWMRSFLLLMTSDLSVPWSGEAYAVDASEWCGEACYAPDAREFIDASGRFSERLRFEAIARREIVVTVCQEKGEDAARSVHERIMNGRVDEDVDELQRIVTILNPASVIPLIPAPAGCLFDAHWRVLFLSPWSRTEHFTVLEARALAQLVSVTVDMLHEC